MGAADVDEMDRDAIAEEVAKESAVANFSSLSEDVQELIADEIIPELAVLKKVVEAQRLAEESHKSGFLDEDFVEAREQEHVSTGNQILLVLVLLLTCKLAAHLTDRLIANSPRAARYMRYLNASTISVFVGWVFGVLMEYSSSASIRETRKFSSELLYYMLLPPIIMEAGYSLRKRRFFSHIVEISSFAVLGTLVSTATVAWILFKLMDHGWLEVLEGASGMELIMFGSLISAVDPVSTLSVLSSSCNDDLLMSLIFGESVFNDAVVIVLTKQISLVLSANAQSTAAAAAAAASHSKHFNMNGGGALEDFDDDGEQVFGERGAFVAPQHKPALMNDVDLDDLTRAGEIRISEHIGVNFVCVVVGSVLHGVLSALL